MKRQSEPSQRLLDLGARMSPHLPVELIREAGSLFGEIAALLFVASASAPDPHSRRRKPPREALVLWREHGQSVREIATNCQVGYATARRWLKESKLPVDEDSGKSGTGLTAEREAARRAKIGEARRGKPRPSAVIEKMREANLGKRASDESRRKMSETMKRRGHRPQNGTSLWTPDEDNLVATLPPAKAAHQTGRTLRAVYSRRNALGLRNGRSVRFLQPE